MVCKGERGSGKDTLNTQHLNILNGCKDLCTEDGSSQGQNVALTVSGVPNSLYSGEDVGLSGVPGPTSKVLSILNLKFKARIWP